MTWWQNLYDEWLALFLLEDQSETRVSQTADFLTGQMGLLPGARVFDQCCGIGNLSRALAKKGFDVVAVDQASSYVKKATAAAELHGIKSVAFCCADARDYVAETCDGVFNWWTSFGYGEDDEDNMRMILRAAESLRAGGVYLLDFMNLSQVLRRFQPQIVNEKHTPAGRVTLIRHSEVRLADGVLQKRWQYLLPDGSSHEHISRVRLYQPADMVAFFRHCGFTEVSCFGDVDASPLGLDSPRCIVRGVKT